MTTIFILWRLKWSRTICVKVLSELNTICRIVLPISSWCECLLKWWGSIILFRITCAAEPEEWEEGTEIKPETERGDKIWFSTTNRGRNRSLTLRKRSFQLDWLWRLWVIWGILSLLIEKITVFLYFKEFSWNVLISKIFINHHEFLYTVTSRPFIACFPSSRVKRLKKQI